MAGAWSRSPEGRKVLAAILTAAPSRGHRRHRHWSRHRGHRHGQRPMVVALALVALLGIAVGTATYVIAQPEPRASTACYDRLDRHADLTGLGPAALADQTPAEACALRWQAVFGQPLPASLLTCVLPSGVTAVFPASPTLQAAAGCGTVGAAVGTMAALQPDTGSGTDIGTDTGTGTTSGPPSHQVSAAQVAAWQADLPQRLGALPGRSRCWPRNALAALLDRSLRGHGLPWTVVGLGSGEPANFTSGEPANFTIDPVGGHVLVVPTIDGCPSTPTTGLK